MKDNDKGGKTAKGIKKNIITKNIKHEDYKEVLFNNKQMHHTMKTIRSNNHQLGSFELNKISLSCFDDKRFIHQNGITSYAYGHYKIWKMWRHATAVAVYVSKALLCRSTYKYWQTSLINFTDKVHNCEAKLWTFWFVVKITRLWYDSFHGKVPVEWHHRFPVFRECHAIVVFPFWLMWIFKRTFNWKNI